MFFNFIIERIIKKNISIFDIIGCVFKINSINNLNPVQIFLRVQENE